MDTAEAYQARREAERRAGREINHFGSSRSDATLDRHECSCGWQSNPYEDGQDLAFKEWVTHIKEHGAEIAYPEPASVS